MLLLISIKYHDSLNSKKLELLVSFYLRICDSISRKKNSNFRKNTWIRLKLNIRKQSKMMVKECEIELKVQLKLVNIIIVVINL